MIQLGELMMILDSSIPPPGIRDPRLRGAGGAIRKPFANTLSVASVRSGKPRGGYQPTAFRSPRPSNPPHLDNRRHAVSRIIDPRIRKVSAGHESTGVLAKAL